jgi:hypothetical protein
LWSEKGQNVTLIGKMKRRIARHKLKVGAKTNPPGDALVQPDLLTKEQLAQCLQIGVRTITNLMRKDLIPYIPVGVRAVRFNRLKVITALERNRDAREQGIAAKKEKSSELQAA